MGNARVKWQAVLVPANKSRSVEGARHRETEGALLSVQGTQGYENSASPHKEVALIP